MWHHKLWRHIPCDIIGLMLWHHIPCHVWRHMWRHNVACRVITYDVLMLWRHIWRCMSSASRNIWRHIPCLKHHIWHACFYISFLLANLPWINSFQNLHIIYAMLHLQALTRTLQTFYAPMTLSLFPTSRESVLQILHTHFSDDSSSSEHLFSESSAL